MFWGVLLVSQMKGRHRAFVLIDVAPGKEKKVLEKVLEYEEVVEAHLIPGEYDVMAVLEFELYGREIFVPVSEMVAKFVIEKIRRLSDVKDTNTILPSLSMVKKAK